MPTLLIKNAYIASMDDAQREIPEGGLFIRDGFIEQRSGRRAHCDDGPPCHYKAAYDEAEEMLKRLKL